MPNLTREQEQMFESVRARVPGLRVRWNEANGVAGMLQGPLLPPNRAETPQQALRSVLEDYGILLGPPDILSRHRFVGARRNKDGTVRVKACQIVDGLPVYDAVLLVFCDARRGVFRVQSSLQREIKPVPEARLKEEDLVRIAREALAADPEGARFEAEWRKHPPNDSWLVDHFPLSKRPSMYLYPVNGEYHPAFDFMAYQPHEWIGVDGRARREIGAVDMTVDAATGRTIRKLPAGEGAYADVGGDGISTLEDSGAHISRSLHVARRDGADYVMLNRLHTPDIKTYDAGGTTANLPGILAGDNDLSLDPDDHWLDHTNSTVAADRRDAQQPEVDCHFNAEQAWAFYHNLGWDGFDDTAWGSPSPVQAVAHVGMGANAGFFHYTSGNREYGYIRFLDGLAAGGNLIYDFMAGDPLIFGHEYQHAVTYFGVTKSTGAPGYLYGDTALREAWLGTIREGYSDSIACLRFGSWVNPMFYPDGAIHAGADFVHPDWGITCRRQPFRRVEYPRSTDTIDGAWYCDHFDDRGAVPADKYRWSTILSHTAFLVGQGGIHERLGRSAQLIPVTSVGLERAAEVMLHALWNYFDDIPLKTENGETLIEAGKRLLDAAEDLSGSNRTPEYVMMRRALYAVGLYPYSDTYVKQTYGGEACMLPWTDEWMFSAPYLGLPSHRWRSPDLFVNNGGAAAYEAVAGQENKLFARVRNIGDQQIDNVTVRFHYRAYGTNLPESLTSWSVCKDHAGADCVLTIASIAAGAMNFTNADAPPAASAVNWYLDPAIITPDIDHFCIRATIECAAANHDNDYAYRVQSNVQHVYGDGIRNRLVKFRAENWLQEPVRLELEVRHTLPKGFRVRYEGAVPLRDVRLRQGEAFPARYRITAPAGLSNRLEPPFAGTARGRVDGGIAGEFEGELADVKAGPLPLPEARSQAVKLSGTLSGRVAGRRGAAKASVRGSFTGTLNLATWVLKGRVEGSATNAARPTAAVKLTFEGALEPLRIVDFTQRVHGKVVGGVSALLHMPRPRM